MSTCSEQEIFIYSAMIGQQVIEPPASVLSTKTLAEGRYNDAVPLSFFTGQHPEAIQYGEKSLKMIPLEVLIYSDFEDLYYDREEIPVVLTQYLGSIMQLANEMLMHFRNKDRNGVLSCVESKDAIQKKQLQLTYELLTSDPKLASCVGKAWILFVAWIGEQLTRCNMVSLEPDLILRTVTTGAES